MREIQSLARGLQIINLLMDSDKPLGVTELANHLDVDKSTASRLVSTLQKHSFVQQEHNSRAYIIGKRLHSISWQLANRYALSEIAKPYLDYLVRETGECSHVGVYSSGQALLTDNVQPEQSILQVMGGVGRLTYLHNTAIGKGLIAFGDFPLPDELPALTPKTITTYEDLAVELAQVRQQGYAIDNEENEPGVRCVAAPIFNAVGTTTASIGISGPTVRVTEDNVDHFGALVREVAHQVSCELGYQGDYPNEDNENTGRG